MISTSTLNHTGCTFIATYYNSSTICVQLENTLAIAGTRNFTRLLIAILTFVTCIVLSIWTCVRRKKFPLPIHGFYYLQFIIFSCAFYGLYNLCLFTVVAFNQFQVISITPVIGLFAVFLNLSMVQLLLQPAVVKLWLIGQSFYINKLKSRLLLFGSSSDQLNTVTAEIIKTNGDHLRLTQIQKMRFICLHLVPVLFILATIILKAVEVSLFGLGYIITTWVAPLPALQQAFQVVYYAAIMLEFIFWPLLCIILFIFIAVLRVKEPFCLIGLSVVFVLVTMCSLVTLLAVAILQSSLNTATDLIVSALYYIIDISILMGVSITALVPIIKLIHHDSEAKIDRYSKTMKTPSRMY